MDTIHSSAVQSPFAQSHAISNRENAAHDGSPHQLSGCSALTLCPFLLAVYDTFPYHTTYSGKNIIFLR